MKNFCGTWIHGSTNSAERDRLSRKSRRTRLAALCAFSCVTLFSFGCDHAPEAGSTDPHGAYTPEQAKAAAMTQLRNKPAPKAQGAHPSQPK